MARIKRSQIIALDGIVPGSQEIWRTAISSIVYIPENISEIVLLPYGIQSEETFGRTRYFKVSQEWVGGGEANNGESAYFEILKTISLTKEKKKKEKLHSIKTEEAFGLVQLTIIQKLHSLSKTKESFGKVSFEKEVYEDTDDDVLMLLLAA